MSVRVKIVFKVKSLHSWALPSLAVRVSITGTHATQLGGTESAGERAATKPTSQVPACGGRDLDWQDMSHLLPRSTWRSYPYQHSAVQRPPGKTAGTWHADSRLMNSGQLIYNPGLLKLQPYRRWHSSRPAECLFTRKWVTFLAPGRKIRWEIFTGACSSQQGRKGSLYESCAGVVQTAVQITTIVHTLYIHDINTFYFHVQ